MGIFRGFEVPEVLRRAMQSADSDIMTGFPGIVKSYDSSKMLAVVTPAVKRPLPSDANDDSVVFEELPDIPDVPTCFYRGGGCYISFPINPGDHVWVAISSLDPGGWRDTGIVSEAKDTRQNHIAHGFAMPCVGPDAAVLAGAAINALVLEGPSILAGVGATEALAQETPLNTMLGQIKADIQSLFTALGAGSPSFATVIPFATTKLKGE